MTQKPEITLDTADSRGFIPSEDALIGLKFTHQGNGHVYTITGFQWNGEDDTWMLAHTREGSDITYLRTPANFFGFRSNGKVRYAL